MKLHKREFSTSYTLHVSPTQKRKRVLREIHKRFVAFQEGSRSIVQKSIEVGLLLDHNKEGVNNIGAEMRNLTEVLARKLDDYLWQVSNLGPIGY